MARQVARGEIWMIDLGMAARVRPCRILSVPFLGEERAVVTFVARTTQQRGGRFEVAHAAANFLPGVFDAQNIGTVPVAKLERLLTRLAPEELAQVERAVQRWLGFASTETAR